MTKREAIEKLEGLKNQMYATLLQMMSVLEQASGKEYEKAELGNL